jgi:hypothetical protein
VSEHPEWDGLERRDEPATTGAQEQIDDLRKQVRHGLTAMATGFILFTTSIVLAVIVIAGVANDASDAIDTAEGERAARSTSVTGVIDLFCDINNAQDSTLAGLLNASNGAEFGDGIDPNTLTPFDIQVLASIARVQALSEDAAPQDLIDTTLAELEDLTPCQKIISLYLAGEEVPTLKELDKSETP